MAELTVEEQLNAAKVKQIAENGVTLSNIVEVASSVILKIAGKDIADSVGNESVSRNVLSNLVANRIKEQVLNGGK